MDVYHIWCDLQPGSSDVELALYRDFPDPGRERGSERF